MSLRTWGAPPSCYVCLHQPAGSTNMFFKSFGATKSPVPQPHPPHLPWVCEWAESVVTCPSEATQTHSESPHQLRLRCHPEGPLEPRRHFQHSENTKGLGSSCQGPQIQAKYILAQRAITKVSILKLRKCINIKKVK